MKRTFLCLSSIATTLMFGIATHAQNYIADQFDSDTTLSLQNQGWGSAVPIVLWDSTQNATTTDGPNNDGSGSSLWSITWPITGDQIMVANWFDGSGTVLNLNNYTNVSFDIMFDPSSATDGAGSYGGIEFGIIPQSDGWPSTALGIYTSATNNGNGWIHVNIPINGASNQKFNAVTGYYIKMQQNRTGANLTGTTMFWLDNIIFEANTAPPPKVTLSASKLTTPPGLMIVAGGSGGTYTRGLLAALDVTNGTRNFSWVGNGINPVTYSQTIVSYPDTNHPIQSAIFLVQNGNLGDPGVDYDAANVAQLSIYGNADGTATGSFQYKTNQPDGNSQFGNNTLATLTAPSPLGTWSITFVNDTNVTLSYVPLSGIGGLSTNANFPDETTVQTYFANPLTVFMGNQQNSDANLGQASTYSEFNISGVTLSPAIDAIWTNQTVLDTTNWSIVNNAPNDAFLVHSTDKYWVSWTLPDANLQLQANTNLANNGGWADIGLTTKVTTTAGNKALLPGMATNFPTGDNVFFLMMNTNSP
ncbi:MAG TPA: hypothetical protein VHG71_06915 [Verrucomicrobiae bacterium]|nr:hypothetical protein [Verrucomicrobiae bacterium]